MKYSPIYIILLLFFTQMSAQENDKDLNNLFNAVTTIEVTPNALQNYFYKITDNYLLTEHRESFTGFFNYVESDLELMNSTVFKDHYYLFKARSYRLSNEFGKAFSSLNNISDKLSGFSKKDSVNYFVMYHLATTELGLFKQSINYAQIINSIDDIPSTREPGMAPDIYFLVSSDLSYNKLGDYKNAIRIAKSKFEKFKELYPKDYYFLFNRANNIGVYYNNYNKPDSALVYFNKAMSYLDYEGFNGSKSTDKYRSFVQGNVAQSYMLMEHYKEAIPLLEDDVEKSLDYFPYNALISSVLLAESHVKLNNVAKAERVLSRFDSISNATERLQNPEFRDKLFAIKAKIAEQKGNHVKAIEILNAQIKFRDSNKAAEKLEEAISLQSAFELEKKEAELLASKVKANEMEVTLNKRNYSIIGGLLLIILLACLLVWYRLNSLKQKAQNKEFKLLTETIAEKNKVINIALQKKDTLLKEIHHRVKNNLQVVSSLLSLQSNNISSTVVREALLDGQARVRSMALVHQRLYETDNYKDIVFNDYIGQLVQNLIATYRVDNKVEYTINSKEIVDIDIAVPLGLIINEVVTNTLKYSEKDVLRLSINFNEKNTNHYKLVISDNALGFNLEEVKKRKTLGLKLIEILVKQLEGNLDIDTSTKSPTTYTIEFPKTDK